MAIVLAAVAGIEGAKSPASAQTPAALTGQCAQAEPLLKQSCGCTVADSLAAGLSPATVSKLVQLKLMEVSPGERQRFFEIKGACLARADVAARGGSASSAPASAPTARAPVATPAPVATSPSSGSGITPLFTCQRTLSIVGEKCPCMVADIRKAGIPDPVAVRLFGRNGSTATPAQAERFNAIVKQCSGYRTTVVGTASGGNVAAAPARGTATASIAPRTQPTGRAGAGACLVPPAMTGPPKDDRRVLFVSDDQMRGQLAALEGTRWRYPSVGMTGNEMAQSGRSHTELLFGADRVVTQRFVSEKQGTAEYRYRAIVADEEPGLDRACDRGAYARPDGTFAGSGEGGRAVRRQLVLRPLDGKGFETEMAIGYWGGKTLYVGENVRWQYFITPATVVSGVPKPVKPVARAAAVPAPSGPLSARIGVLAGIPKGISYNCDTMIWRQTAAVKTARQLAGLRDKRGLALVMADLAGVGGGLESMALMRVDGQTLNFAAVNEGGQTVWKSGDLRVTRRDMGQYALPNEPGIGFGDGVLTVRHGAQSVTIPFVSQSVC